MHIRLSSNIKIPSLILVFLGLLSILWTLHILSLPQDTHESLSETRYAVYFDAGSSGTRIHIFEYRPPRDHLHGSYVDLILPDISKSIEPGLSHYASDPVQAGASLEPLLDFAYLHVPEDLRRETPVRLMATAGLRLVPEMERNSILHYCRTRLSSSHFAFKQDWAAVIPGEMEGLYAWAGANYASGALQEASKHSKGSESLESYHGVLELGGASFQVTFLHNSDKAVLHEETRDFKSTPKNLKVPLPGLGSWQLFTHSYLGLGMDAAVHSAAAVVKKRWEAREKKAMHSLDSSIPDPCLPVGYSSDDGRYGASSFAGCLSIALEVLPTSGSKCRIAAKAALEREVEKSILLLASHHPSSILLNETKAKLGKDLLLSASQVNDKDKDKGKEEDGEISVTGLNEAVLAANALASPDSGEISAREEEEESEQCTVDGVKAPLLSGKFLAVENLYWTTKALGLLHSEVTLEELREAGYRYCSHHWSSLHAEFSGHVPDVFLTRYCFGAAYIFALLHVGLGVGLDERRVTFTNTLKRKQRDADGEMEKTVNLNWVTGAAVIDVMAGESRRAKVGARRVRFIAVPAIIFVFGLVLFLSLRLTRIRAGKKQGMDHSGSGVKKRSSSALDLEATERGEYDHR